MLPMNLHSRVNKQWSGNINSLFLRPGGNQCGFMCRTMYHAPVLRRDIWDNCFVEVTGSGLASYPQPRSPQADSMVLFGAFCNFCVQKKKRKNLFQNDLNECILFMYMKMKRYRSVNRDVFCAGKDGKASVFGGLLCLFLLVCLLCFFISTFFFFFYWAFYIIIKHFLLTFIENPLWEKALVGAMTKQSHLPLVQHCVQWHWLLLGRQTWYCFLPPPR